MFRNLLAFIAFAFAGSAPAQDVSPPASSDFQGARLECPCRLSVSDQTTLTLAVRNYRAAETGELAVQLRHNSITVATMALDRVASNRVQRGVHVLKPEHVQLLRTLPSWVQSLKLLLLENSNGKLARVDHVIMELERSSRDHFEARDLDYLVDTDGDGVGDINERMVGSDPNDGNSSPGNVTMDVLAVYNSAFADVHGGHPQTRIRHLMTVTDEIFRNSETGIQLRLVGVQQAEVEGSEVFAGLNFDLSERLRLEAGADIVVMFRRRPPETPVCGFAVINGLGARGHFSSLGTEVATYFSHCGARTVAHEIGHLMGLHHSFRQQGVGTFLWSRGHYFDVYRGTGTVMSYSRYFEDLFSNPARKDCDGGPCGQDIAEADGANAVASLKVARFQFAALAEGQVDTDGDGIVDSLDAFPDDHSEWLDSDKDGVGDVADPDDDNDGVVDDDDPFPLNPLEWADRDDDGVGDNTDAFPDDPKEYQDTDGDGVGDNGDRFPADPRESADADGDGVGDNGDAFPDDPGEFKDTDGDGIGDNGDTDDDDDGVMDTHDAFPVDPDKVDIASYVIRGGQAGDGAGEVLSSGGDFNRDGVADFAIGAPRHSSDQRANSGAVYVLSGIDLRGADAADGEVDRVVSLDHVASQPGSWKLVGDVDDQVGQDIVIGDWSGDGWLDLTIGGTSCSRQSSNGLVYLVDGTRLSQIDAIDGALDGIVDLSHVGRANSSWVLVGDAPCTGSSVALSERFDGSSSKHIFVGASGNVYVVSAVELPNIDAEDGSLDGRVAMANIAGAINSWKLVSAKDAFYSGIDRGLKVVAADMGGSDFEEIIVTGDFDFDSTGYSIRRSFSYVVDNERLAVVDGADDRQDGVVALVDVADARSSWELVGNAQEHFSHLTVESPTTYGRSILVLGAFNTSYVVSSDDLREADGSGEEETDGSVLLSDVVSQPGSFSVPALLRVLSDIDGDGIDELSAVARGHSNQRGEVYVLDGTRLALEDLSENNFPKFASRHWTIVGARSFRRLGADVTVAGDIDEDGLSDLLIGAPGDSDGADEGEIFVVLAADLSALDAIDGSSDGRLLLGNVGGDTDRDGQMNFFDFDDDGDGIPDRLDAFPLDGSRWADRDGDGVADDRDAFPDDAAEHMDTDKDGTGDNMDFDDDNDGIADHEDDYPLDTDNDGMDNAADDDDDNDGVADAEDDFPFDAGESEDSDGDGVGNNADDDDDNDGFADADDAFPTDRSEHRDSDSDGVGDVADAFPNDPRESIDSDYDGVGNNADEDDDNDGVADAEDAFPTDPGRSQDRDGDGVADVDDNFPDDPAESRDHDRDGIGNNSDPDNDNDGVPNVEDLFPFYKEKSSLMSYKLTGETDGDLAGFSMSGHGGQTLVLGAPGHGRGAVYAIAPRGYPDYDGADNLLLAADALDGRTDHVIALWSVAALARETVNGDSMYFWKFRGESNGPRLGVSVAGFPGTEFTRNIFANIPESFVLVGAAESGTAFSTVYGFMAPYDYASRDIEVGRSTYHSWWKVEGIGPNEGAGFSLAALGDVDNDGVLDYLISRPGQGLNGASGRVEVVFGRLLSDDGSVDVSTIRKEGWSFVGEELGDYAGFSVDPVGDLDGDGMQDILIGAPGYDDEVELGDRGAAYLVLSAAIDLGNGAGGSRVDLASVAAMRNGWKFVGGNGAFAGSSVSAAGDVDRDGVPDILIGAPGYRGDRDVNLGAAYLIFGARLSMADRADGREDGVIELENVAPVAGWKFVGSVNSGLGEVAATGGHGVNLLIFGSSWVVGGSGINYVLDGGSLQVLDYPADNVVYDDGSGFGDGVIDLAAAARNSRWLDEYASAAHLRFTEEDVGVIYRPRPIWVIDARPDPRAVYDGIGFVAGFGDLDSDYVPDFSVGVPTEGPGAAYFVSGIDLPFLDIADGKEDGRVILEFIREIDRRTAKSLSP